MSQLESWNYKKPCVSSKIVMLNTSFKAESCNDPENVLVDFVWFSSFHIGENPFLWTDSYKIATSSSLSPTGRNIQRPPLPLRWSLWVSSLWHPAHVSRRSPGSMVLLGGVPWNWSPQGATLLLTSPWEVYHLATWLENLEKSPRPRPVFQENWLYLQGHRKPTKLKLHTSMMAW